MVYGFAKGLEALNDLGNKTTAFNLAGIVAVLVAFAAHNVQQLVGAHFHWPEFNAPNDTEAFRKVLGLFALVQGFEASRYLGAYFPAEMRIKTMRAAQYVASIVFVLFVAFSLILFAQTMVPANAEAIFVVSKQVSVFLPFLIMAVALGSELSAILNAAESRTDLLVQQAGGRFSRRWSFPLLLVPTIFVVVLTDVTSAVALPPGCLPLTTCCRRSWPDVSPGERGAGAESRSSPESGLRWARSRSSESRAERRSV